ncbi:hypothetical protein BT96DRAFT_1005270 [Gymnopus androsaceus JB14]|uniref:Uncharacterized protein n=1 Tax=Gymnopus androsaceus JB14 TaxID=1447944 RepID=A0A6A4GND6_9AGAR|nr:hypothetical protein BT96DRAFT_1005270 [Gymnopus androsaceus JB14]
MITYCITNLGVFKSLKSASNWRKLIGMELHGTKTDSKAADKRRELVDELQKTMVANSENLVDFSNIQAIVPPNIITMSFNLELVMADFVFYEPKPPSFDNVQFEEGEDLGFDPELDAPSCKDREIKLQAWMPGFNSTESEGLWVWVEEYCRTPARCLCIVLDNAGMGTDTRL